MIGASVLKMFRFREIVPAAVSETSEPRSRFTLKRKYNQFGGESPDQSACECRHLEFDSNNDVHCMDCGRDFTD